MDNFIFDIIELVKEQGSLMRCVNDVEGTNGNIKVKPGDANFVTVYDEAVQNNLIGGLVKILPDAVFLAEEKDNSDIDTTKGYCFIIDPIDGTTNFIHSMGASAISVGLFRDGQPFAGIIYDPYRDEVFYAQTGCGAYLNGKKISVSERPLEQVLFSFGSSPYDKTELGEKGFAAAKRLFHKTADIRRSGSAAIDIGCVACGRTDAFFETKLSPWDYAAGITIITEAGGCISDYDGNNLSLNKPSSFLCSNRVVYEEVKDIITEED